MLALATSGTWHKWHHIYWHKPRFGIVLASCAPLHFCNLESFALQKSYMASISALGCLLISLSLCDVTSGL